MLLIQKLQLKKCLCANYAIDTLSDDNRLLICDNVGIISMQNEISDGLVFVRDAEEQLSIKNEAMAGLFAALCAFVLFLQALIPQIKVMWSMLKKRRIVTEKYTAFLPKFLYSNNILTRRLTGNKEIEHRQIDRYKKIMVDKLQELWNIPSGIRARILPCDWLEGPFVNSLKDLFSANEFIKLLMRNPLFDAAKTIGQNFMENKFFYYFYQLDLTFFALKWNDYERKLHLARTIGQYDSEQPQSWDSRQQINKKNGLKSRQQMRHFKQVDALEKTIVRKDDRIEYLENLLQEHEIEYD